MRKKLYFALAAAVLLVFVAYRETPAQITTIQGTDTVAGSRAVINANFSWLATRVWPTTLGGLGVSIGGCSGMLKVTAGTVTCETWPFPIQSANIDSKQVKTANIDDNAVGAGQLANNAVGSAQMAVVNTRRVCDMAFGDSSATVVLADGTLGPQKRVCFIPAAAHIVELMVSADGGTPQILIGRRHTSSVSNLTSSALATAGSGGVACANVAGSGTSIDGATTCSVALTTTTAAAGDYFEPVSGTAGGVAKWMAVHIVFLID